jgi:hypothetical protein
MRLLLFSVAAALMSVAGCTKEKDPQVNPALLPPLPYRQVNLCTASGTVYRETVLTGVEMEGPLENSGIKWREAAVAVPQIIPGNTGCLRVFVAQEAAGPWTEIYFPNNTDAVDYRVNTTSTYTLRIVARENQVQVPSVDFRKPFAVRVLYKTF